MSGPGQPSESSATPPSPSSPTESCDGVVDGVVDVVQRYVDQYDTAAAPARAAASAPNLPRQFRQARTRMRALGCDMEQTTDRLTRGLERVEAQGPLAEAVKQQLVASITGRVGAGPTTEQVRPGGDLREVLPTLAPGSTVRLTAGRHRLPETVVLLQGVRLIGAGRERTVLTSQAPDAALLALTPSRVDLQALTLRHVGDEPASLVVGSTATRLALTRVAMVGARLAPAAKGEQAPANGGSGVLMAGEGATGGGPSTTLEVTDSVFRDNQAAGILLSGSHVASVTGTSFLAGGQCGVCFTGDSSGVVRDARFQGGVTGVIAAGTAAPLLRGSTVEGAEIGVQAVDRASPVIRSTTIADASRAAMLFGDRSRGRVDGVTCQDTRFELVVAKGALPFVGRTDCQVQPMG